MYLDKNAEVTLVTRRPRSVFEVYIHTVQVMIYQESNDFIDEYGTTLVRGQSRSYPPSLVPATDKTDQNFHGRVDPL